MTAHDTDPANYADAEARSDYLAERPQNDDADDYYADEYCDNCGLELRRNTQTGRCRHCGDKP